MSITNGIRVTTQPLPAKAIALIRRTTGLSISDIRQRSQDGSFLMERDLSDDESLREMIELSTRLCELGIETELYQGGYKRTLEFMKNVYAAHMHTAQEVGLRE